MIATILTEETSSYYIEVYSGSSSQPMTAEPYEEAEAENEFLFLTQVFFLLFNVKASCCYVHEHPAGQVSIILCVPKVQTETGKMDFGFSAS